MTNFSDILMMAELRGHLLSIYSVTQKCRLGFLL